MKDIYIEQSLKSHILRNALREAISSGEFNTGDRFPSEIELSAKYHISRGTIREAIASLVQEGLLYRIQGKGTFVQKKTQEPLTIALMIPHLRMAGRNNGVSGYDITPCIIHAIENETKKHGARVFLYLSNDDLEMELTNFENVVKHKPDAAVILYTGNTDAGERLDTLVNAEIPFVLLDKYVKGFNYDYIGTQNTSGAYEAVSNLINIGYKNIYHITHSFSITSATDRKIGYLKALQENNLEPHLLFLTPHGVSQRLPEDELAYDVTKSILKSVSLPFAIFAVNSPVLDGVWKAIDEERIPHDQFALCLVDEPYTHIPEDITIIKMIQPIDQISQKAVHTLIDKINGNNMKIHIEYPAEIQTIYGKKSVMAGIDSLYANQKM